MREDYQENLAKMFPRGFLIVYVNKNDSISYRMENPELVEQLFQIEDGLLEFAQDNE